MALASGTRFARWGTPPHPVGLSAAAESFLTERLGDPTPASAHPARDIAVASPRLGAPDLERLSALVGADGVSTDSADRLGHAAGCSLTDYLTLRRAELDPGAVPDAVVRPASHDQVRDVLSLCANERIVVVPYGGGTSVVGGVTAVSDRPRIALAFDRMAEVLAIDEDSMTVTVQPGITGPVLERILQARGLTWGHLPQSWERATIGGYAATRSAGQASTGYGRSDEMIEELRVATPMGDLTLGRGPASAAGPDLRQLFIGSEGAYGVITEVSLRVRHLPTASRYEGLMFPSYESGVAAFRDLAQYRATADVMRLSDVPETTATLAMSGSQGRTGQVFDRYLEFRNVAGGCMAILGWEGYSKRMISARRSAAWALMKDHKPVSLGTSVGNSWRRHRYDGPYLRDTLLDRGYIVETLETATHWSGIHRLREAVSGALTDQLSREGRQAYVMSHISHVYETGASLYFTAIVAAAEDPVAQWAAAKSAAMDAITAADGTITHHHAVGRDHMPWLEAEVGLEGMRLLRGIKALVDPQGVLNPGVLSPER